ncbi:MAG: ABC transporter permease [Acidimicrobiales bacterium]
MNLGFQLHRRMERSLRTDILVPVVSVLAALVAGAVFLAVEGYDPVAVYRALVEASFTTWFGITDSLAAASPLILTGLAAALTFRMKLFNIGAEGQLYLGAIGASWAGLALAAELPRPLAAVVMLLVGAAAGALWILPAAVFRAWLGTSEIITTLMLTFVGLFLMRYLIFGGASFWRDPLATNFPQGRRILPEIRFDTFGTTRVHWGLVIGVVAVVVVWVLIRFTRVGFDMKVVGSSPAAARYAGIPVRRTIMTSLLLSGALAGIAGAAEVGGRAFALDPNGLQLGLGFTGIVVAALGRYNAWGVLIVALMLGGLRNAGTALQSVSGERVPEEVSQMLQGAILLFATGGEVFLRHKLVRRRKGAALEPAPAATPAEVAA